MKANDVLIDLMQDSFKRIKYLVENVPDGALHWSPDGEANSLATTAWHVGRGLDLFLVQHVLGHSAENERWFASGWAEKTGYDPRGIGHDGWGNLIGYTQEEVKAMPLFSAETLVQYLTEAVTAVNDYLEAHNIAHLEQPSAGYGQKYSNYFWLKLTLFDMTRHVGDMMAIHEMWKRRHKF